MSNRRWSQQSHGSLNSPPPFEGPNSIRENRYEPDSEDANNCIGKVNDLVGRCFDWRQRKRICSPSRRGQAKRDALDEEREGLIREASSLAQSCSMSDNQNGYIEAYELVDKVKSQLITPEETKSVAFEQMLQLYGKPSGTIAEQIELLKPMRYELALAETALRLLHVDQLCLWAYLEEPAQIIRKWRHCTLVQEHARRVSETPDYACYGVTSLACMDTEKLLDQMDDWGVALDIEEALTDDQKMALQQELAWQIPRRRPSMPAGKPVQKSAHEWLLENNRLRAASLLLMTKFAVVEHISTLLHMPKAASITRERIEHFAANQNLYSAEKIRQSAQTQMIALPKRFNSHQFWPEL